MIKYFKIYKSFFQSVMPKSWKIGTIGTFLMSYDIVECMLLAKTGVYTYFQKPCKKSLQNFVKKCCKTDWNQSYYS